MFDRNRIIKEKLDTISNPTILNLGSIGEDQQIFF